MNDAGEIQFRIDFLTGSPTAITGVDVSPADRKASSVLNRQRARGIQETAKQVAPRESLSLDVWTSLVARRAREWDVPLIALSSLGFYQDDAEIMCSSKLVSLDMGKEASAWLHRDSMCVYKLFDLKKNGALGQKLVIEMESQWDCRVSQRDAVLAETLEKLCVLHEAGGCPTEIVGLSDDGNYLISKQPRCKMHRDFYPDRRLAVKAVNAVEPKGAYGMEIWVFWQDGQAWCLGDLHEKNVFRTYQNDPTIIDALIGSLPPLVLKRVDKIAVAAQRARALALGLQVPSEDLFDGIDDEDL